MNVLYVTGWSSLCSPVERTGATAAVLHLHKLHQLKKRGPRFPMHPTPRDPVDLTAQVLEACPSCLLTPRHTLLEEQLRRPTPHSPQGGQSLADLPQYRVPTGPGTSTLLSWTGTLDTLDTKRGLQQNRVKFSLTKISNQIFLKTQS